MRIALPNIAAGTGGDVYTRALVKELGAQGVHAELLEFSYDMEFLPWLRAASARRQLHDFDLMHCNGDYASLFHLADTPTVITLHHNVLVPEYQRFTSLPQKLYHHGLLGPRIRKAARQASGIVFVSENARASFADLLAGIETPQHMIYNCVDSGFFRPPQHPPAGGRCRLLFVGSLSRRKGAHLLPAIMAGLGEDYELTCVSRGAKSFDAPNIRVIDAADRSELLTQYQQADLFLFPSLLEGFGFTVAEAMACGLPVVTSRCSSLPEVVGDSDAQLVTPGEVEGYIAAVKALWQDESSRVKIGRRNRERVLQLFSPMSWATRYVDLYKAVLNRQT